ncbi:tRNA preQ1(34) S-adenosylmethionine ribosyltransferase-isomerase QueA [Candidatus Parcubacteria bacterium]|nr:MAG: tRNA preQ1(34) S-adenosylmethionine ribosyltransferase-isomerase QueA [Candidatus Parcubacteria bacterium]
MKTSDFDYNLPTSLIAQKSIEPRDHSKFMIINKENKTVEHKQFFDVVDYLEKGDLLVWNNSKVFKARLFGRLESTDHDIDKDGVPDKPLLKQQEVEIFLVRPMENEGVWHVMAKPGKHVDNGMRVKFAEDFYCDVMIKKKDGTILVQFPYSDDEVRKKANIHGHIPVPPYVKDEPHQLEMYQTVYADDAQEGSVAAPTAGFHFTDDIIEKLKIKGVEFADVTLHVGLGTFLPIKSEHVDDHIMHSEWVELSQDNAKKINKAKQEGRRVVSVGTTTVRTLEGIAMLKGYEDKKFEEFKGDINLFIKPGFQFQVVDAMITNFHLPKSTLLMLVSAFAGDQEFMLECYKKAVEETYRFFSFGDSMFIH